jgi:hypothetical protein
MKSGALRRALGLTLLYIGGFVLLVLLQFSRGPGFSEKFGRLAVTATFPKAEAASGGQVPDSVRIDYAGFIISLSSRSPAILVGADAAARPAALRAIEKRRDGVRVLLEGGIELKVSVGAGDSFAFSAQAPAGAKALRLPYGISGRARLGSAGGAYSLDSGGASFGLGLSAASIEQDSGFLVLALDEGTGSLGRLAIARKAAPPAPTGKPASGEKLAAQAPKDPAAFKAEVDAWRDKAWAGLSSSRYDADRLAWRGKADAQGAPSEARFSERALAAYLAESLARGSYADALSRMKGAKERWRSELGYLSAPYLGGIVAKMAVLESGDQAESKRLAQLVEEKSPDLLAKEGLVRFLLDRAPAGLAKDALAFAASVDPAKLATRQAVGLVGCAVEARSLLADADNPLRSSAAVGAAADKVAAAVKSGGSGLFLVTDEDGSTDLRLSLVAGQYLIAYGNAEGKAALVGLGQGLVEGYLGLADDQGIAPAKLVLRAGAIDQKAGALLPEEAYPVVAANPYYPREISLYKEIGQGSWAWTCAPSVSLSSSQGRSVFEVGFPEGRSHFMALYGIKPFSNIQLYDIDYSPDAEFEIYDASGYSYHKQSDSLYMKMKHKKETESIKLFF